jgi:hypothetical protein
MNPENPLRRIAGATAVPDRRPVPFDERFDASYATESPVTRALHAAGGVIGSVV